MARRFYPFVLIVIASGLLFLCAYCAAPRPGGGPAPGGSVEVAGEKPERPRPLVELVQESLPGVVLLLNYRPDGKLGYGSGLLLDDDGLVLTCLHVVKNANSLYGLLYDPERVSYTPLDGGLGRYVFEHQKSLVPAKLVRGDPNADLALVKIAADTSDFARLSLATGLPRAGEEVVALGHPQESVWSFTQGVVSAIHHGAIQHDAAVNVGNSGGPLIDRRGKVVGINTFKVLGGAEGMAFARPVGMATHMLDDGTTVDDGLAFDLSAPAKAAASCFRAVEAGSPRALECIDFDSGYRFIEVVTKKVKANNPAAAAGIGLAAPTRAEYVKFAKKYSKVQLGLESEDTRRDALRKLFARISDRITSELDDPAKRRQMRDKIVAKLMADNVAKESDRYAQRLNEEVFERIGMKLDVNNPRSFAEILKMGTRIERVHRVDENRAWLLVCGRNLDGSPYRMSQLRVKKDGKWLEDSVPTGADVDARPADWPPTLMKDLREQLQEMEKDPPRLKIKWVD